MYMNHKPLLIFVRGIPGSGKSFLSEALTKKIGLKNTVLLDPDAIDEKDPGYISLSKDLTQDGLPKTIHPFRWLRKSACEAISSGKTVIWNQPFTDLGVFSRLILFIEENSAHNSKLEILIIEVSIDQDTAKERIQSRIAKGGHGPSDSTFQKRVNGYETFSDSYQTIEINGNDTVELSVDKVLQKIDALQD